VACSCREKMAVHRASLADVDVVKMLTSVIENSAMSPTSPSGATSYISRFWNVQTCGRIDNEVLHEAYRCVYDVYRTEEYRRLDV
jgi:hypothetical protein